jgi:hypothetical protein
MLSRFHTFNFLSSLTRHEIDQEQTSFNPSRAAVRLSDIRSVNGHLYVRAFPTYKHIDHTRLTNDYEEEVISKRHMSSLNCSQLTLGPGTSILSFQAGEFGPRDLKLLAAFHDTTSNSPHMIMV